MIQKSHSRTPHLALPDQHKCDLSEQGDSPEGIEKGGGGICLNPHLVKLDEKDPKTALGKVSSDCFKAEAVLTQMRTDIQRQKKNTRKYFYLHQLS